MTSLNISERGLIRKISNLIPVTNSEQLVKGIGDDCGVFRAGSGTDELWLITTDTLTESVHFDLSWHRPELVGRKSASVNISDIAAMGGTPKFALLSIALPSSTPESLPDRFIAGFLDVLRFHNVLLIGGDTVKSRHDIAFTVTIVGQAKEKQILYRRGAQVNDLVWVSGPLGEAAAGLELCRLGESDFRESFKQLIKAHLDPEAQVDLGLVLAECGHVNAMMDLSDGLATDLAHLCSESGVGAEINASGLPVSNELIKAASRLNCSTVDWALTGGEDYHLIFTTAPDMQKTLPSLIREKTGKEIHCIGRIINRDGVHLNRDGRITEITFQGYDHFTLHSS